MTKNDIIDLVADEAIFYDDLELAIIGVAERFGMPTVVCYDKNKTIEILKDSFSVSKKDLEDGETIEDKKLEMAMEWFYFNTLGAWYGEYTPVFITINRE